MTAMTDDNQTKDTFISLILRLTLGVIFLYHGIEKIRLGEMGADWAAKTWGQAALPPEGVVKHLDKAITKRTEQLDRVTKELDKDAADLQEKLKTAKDEDKERIQKELDTKQKTLEDAKKEKAAIEEARTPLQQAFTHHYTTTNLQMPEAFRYYAVQLLVAWGEVLGGAALLLGLLTRVAAAGMMIIQLGAIYTLTATRGFTLGSIAEGGGPEYNVALVVMCLLLVLEGAGALSVDHVILRGHRARRAGGSLPPAPAPTT